MRISSLIEKSDSV